MPPKIVPDRYVDLHAKFRPFTFLRIYLVVGLTGVGMFAVCILAQFMFVESPIRYLVSVIAGMTTAGLVCVLMYQANARRLDSFERMMVVAECNHHIRNALQSMQYQAYVNGYVEINEAVRRIEMTLTAVLPSLIDPDKRKEYFLRPAKSRFYS